MATMNFNFYDYDGIHRYFTLPLNPEENLFDEMKKRVCHILGVRFKIMYWDDGDSLCSLNDQYDLEAAVEFAIVTGKKLNKDPEIQIKFDRPEEVANKALTVSDAIDDINKKTEANFVKMMTEMSLELKQRRENVEAKENALAEREKAVIEKESWMDEMKNSMAEVVRTELEKHKVEMKVIMEEMGQKMDELTRMLEEKTDVPATEKCPKSKEVDENKETEKIAADEEELKLFDKLMREAEKRGYEDDIDSLLTKHEQMYEKDIELVMDQANVSRQEAIQALREHDHDVINAIMDLTM